MLLYIATSGQIQSNNIPNKIVEQINLSKNP